MPILSCCDYYCLTLLHVYFHPTVPPTVTTIDPPLPIVVDTEIELTCNVTGEDPPDTITWTFNGTEIFQGNETTGGNFNLMISSDDYGNYTCTSSNEFGSNNSTVEVTRAGMVTIILI